MYCIEKRYEVWKRGPKIEWTKWFIYMPGPFDENTATELISSSQTAVKDIEKITKLKHEFRISEI